MRKKKLRRAAILLMALILSAAACGNNAATFMRLKRLEGRVTLFDDKDERIRAKEELPLYDGYGMTTRDESYAWIELDSVKLAKLDQNSEIEIGKKKRKLEIEVKSGSLFFHITEPLEEDESLNIRTSTMAVGIRGTCGWVEVPKEAGVMQVYLLEGRVECTAGDMRAVVAAGEKAVMEESGAIEVSLMRAEDIPDFVLEELRAEKDLAQAVLEASGIDVNSLEDGDSRDNSSEEGTESSGEDGSGAESQEPPVPQMTPEVEAALAQYRVTAGQAGSYDFDNDYDWTAYGYYYALVQMQEQNEIPALLLRGYWQMPDYAASGLTENIIVFQYDPDTGSVNQASEYLKQGGRNAFYMAGDGVGLLDSWYAVGTSNGGGTTSRVTLNGGVLEREELWSSSNLEENPDWTEEIGHLPIIWYDTEDTSGLDAWTPVSVSGE